MHQSKLIAQGYVGMQPSSYASLPYRHAYHAPTPTLNFPNVGIHKYLIHKLADIRHIRVCAQNVYSQNICL